MRFASPEMLWLLLLSPLLALGALGARHLRRRALERFAAGARQVAPLVAEVSTQRRAVKLLLLHVTLLAMVLALARPQWGARAETLTRRGADVVVVLDTSLSMAAEDLVPSRLDHARHAVGRLLDRIVGDRVALVTTAGRATVACPLTVDHAAVRLFLDAIDVEAVSVPGTSLAEGLRSALAALGPRGAGVDRGRAVLLFSDGEDHEGGIEGAAAELARAGVVVYAVGCGTAQGAPIPLHDPSGTLRDYKKDQEGRLVTTRLDEGLLERIALETGGRYYRATANEIEVDEIARALGELDAGEVGSLLRTRYEERFQLPLLVGWLALLIESLLGDRRRGRVPPAPGEGSA